MGFSKKELIDGITGLIKTVPTKPGSGILSSFFLKYRSGMLSITCTDHVIFATKCVSQGDIVALDEFECVIEAKKFSESVSAMPGSEIELMFNGRSLTIKSEIGKSKMEIHCADIDEFPKVETSVQAVYTFGITCGGLLNALKHTLEGRATNIGNPMLMCVNVTVSQRIISFASSSSFRVFRYNVDRIDESSVEKPFSALIPGDSLEALVAILEKSKLKKDQPISVKVGERFVGFYVEDDFELKSALMEYKFPDVDKLISDTEAGDSDAVNFYLMPDDVKTALKIFKSLINEKERTSLGQISVSLSENEIKMVSKDTATGSAETTIPTKYSGEPFTFKIHLEALEKMVGCFKDEISTTLHFRLMRITCESIELADGEERKFVYTLCRPDA